MYVYIYFYIIYHLLFFYSNVPLAADFAVGFARARRSSIGFMSAIVRRGPKAAVAQASLGR